MTVLTRLCRSIRWQAGFGMLLAFLVACATADAQPVAILSSPESKSDTQRAAPQLEDGWTIEQDEQLGVSVRTKVLTLHPRAAPEPALKYRLMPDEFDLLPGNAAPHYLKAMGYFEQDPARRAMYQFLDESREKGAEQGTPIHELPPYNWLSIEPSKLPRQEVHDYLRYSSFQVRFLREAARRRFFDMERDLRNSSDPIGTLLPEIQIMREMSRNQSIRIRLAIAEHRIDDAMEMSGQQFALANHLGQEEFLICNLVGVAIASVGWNDMLYLVEHPETPNLYWALSAMPQPLVSFRRSLAYERQMLYEQLKVLREVDGSPRPAGYWSDFLDRLGPQLASIASELDLPRFDEDPELAKSALVWSVAAAYPDAKRYLIERWGMPPEKVEAYPTAQVVFLALVRFHDYWSDELFKWFNLPVAQVRAKVPPGKLTQAMQAEAEQYGWIALTSQLFLPAIDAARLAAERSEQKRAVLMTVEAIRMYAAEHDGQLPPSLEALSVPAPLDPLVGKPLAYERLDDRAILSGHPFPGLQERLVLRIAE